MRSSDGSSDVCSTDQPNGPGNVTERTVKCPIPNSQPTDVKEYVCGGSIYCINGSCSEIEEEASNEFKDALVAMGAIDQVGKEFDPDTMGLFKGTRETCHKPVIGLVNCCAGKDRKSVVEGKSGAGRGGLGGRRYLKK